MLPARAGLRDAAAHRAHEARGGLVVGLAVAELGHLPEAPPRVRVRVRLRIRVRVRVRVRVRLRLRVRVRVRVRVRAEAPREEVGLRGHRAAVVGAARDRAHVRHAGHTHLVRARARVRARFRVGVRARVRVGVS